MVRKGTPIFKEGSLMKVPNYAKYREPANEYLDLEDKLHVLKRREKSLKKLIYATSNEMATVSRDKLGLLGHRVVDELRKTRNSKEAKDEEV